MEYPSGGAKKAVEQSGYAGTALEHFITFIKRTNKKTGTVTFNPYMTVDGRIAEVASEVEEYGPFSIWTYFNTNELDKQFAAVVDENPVNIIVPAQSCVAVFQDPRGGIHFGTASIGSTGMVDKTNPLENAETSAVGRALGLAGYGLIPGAGIASAEEIDGALSREAAQEEPWRTCSVSELGGEEIPADGWGRDKKFGSMTLKEIYETDDGYGAMEWAAGLTDPSGVTAMMARYFNLREGMKANLGESDPEIVLIAGKKVLADAQIPPQWAQWVAKLANQKTGEGKLFGHARHLTNHLKKHFNAAKIVDLTGRKAAALVRYMQSDGEDKDLQYYSDAAGDKEDLFGEIDLVEIGNKAVQSGHLPIGMSAQDWLAGEYAAYGIEEPLAPKQKEGVAKILNLIVSGTLNVREMSDDDPMMPVLVQAFEKVAENGK